MAMIATLGRDLAVDLGDSRPGMLARAAEAIAGGGLNIDGFAEVEGVLHLLTADPRSARLALDAAGLHVTGETSVLLARLDDEAGAAATVFKRLAAAGVNVRYTYVASRNRIVIAADEVERALGILETP
jgi:hypothetical protein